MINHVRGRFAPSPTGEMHLGNAWTALLAWLQIRKLNGTVVLRLEDLDPDRSKAVYAKGIEEDLRWLGLDWDEGYNIGGLNGSYIQSERKHVYDEVIERLNRQEIIYPCFCSRSDIRSVVNAPHNFNDKKEYYGDCWGLSDLERSTRIAAGKRYSLRLHVENKIFKFRDEKFGLISINPSNEIGDFIIKRSDGIYAYQFAVVVDDASMRISHVLRGADLIRSTILQICLYHYLEWPVPQFTHVPLIYGPDGQRLSKRHGNLSLRALRNKGIAPEKIIGYLGFLAGLIPQPVKVKTKDLIPLFDIKKLPKDNLIISYKDLEGII